MTFKTCFNGFDKIEVLEYIDSQDQAVKASNQAYEEKLEQMHNATTILMRENEALSKECNRLKEDIKRKEKDILITQEDIDQAENIKKENEVLLDRIAKLEQIEIEKVSTDERCKKLENEFLIYEQKIHEAQLEIERLETQNYNLSQKLIEMTKQCSTEIAKINMDQKMEDEKANCEIDRIRALLKKVEIGLNEIYN